MAFNVGDVVFLKSGSPNMTVVSLRQEDDGTTYVRTAWFVENKPESHTFPADALEAYVPQKMDEMFGSF